MERSYDDPIIKELIANFIGFIDLNSDEAIELRRFNILTHKYDDNTDIREEQTELGADFYMGYIAKVENNDLDAWWHLNYFCSLIPQENSAHYIINDTEADLRKLPFWALLNSEQKLRFINAAYKYVSEYTPKPEEWIGTDKELNPDKAGYRSIMLLMNEDDQRFNLLDQAFWDTWTPIIVGYPRYNYDEDSPSNILTCKAYNDSPTIFLKYLKRVLVKECTGSNSVPILKLIKDCNDDRIICFLLELLKEDSLSPLCRGQIHYELTKRDFKPAIKSIYDLLSIKEIEKTDVDEQVVEYLVNLLRVNAAEGWDIFQNIINKYQYLAGNILKKLSYNSSDNEASIFDKLSELQLSDLFYLLEKNFPRIPIQNDNIYYSLVESVQFFKSKLINHLISKGSYEAVNSLEKIQLQFPEYDWIHRVIYETKMNMFSKTRVPIQARYLLELANDRHKRLVNNGDELIEVILDSLKRINARLQGETPEAKFLWNKNAPKDENDLSDYIKNRLEDELKRSAIIVNREVEIRRSSGGKPGERTDIHVNAIMHDPLNNNYDVISAIIEVKGCWHKELNKAMKTQLCDRYLKDNQCRHGIYLVGWFVCPQWKKEHRKLASPKISLDEFNNILSLQAKEVSKNGINIKSFILNASLR